MSTTARLFRTARLGCDVKDFSLRLATKQAARSSTYFRSVPGVGEQRATSVAHPSNRTDKLRRQNTQLGHKRDSAKTHHSNFIHEKGRKYDFFEYYLQKQFPLKRLRLSPWIASWTAEPETLPPQLYADPLRILNDAAANPKLVKLCLQTFVAQVHRDHGNAPEARELYRSAKTGTRALLWFLQDAFERVDMTLDVMWSEILVHCLVAEGEAYKALYKWMTVDYTPKYVEIWEAKEQNRWRGTLLYLTLNSIAYWAKDASTGLNDSLLYFDHIWNTYDTSHRILKAQSGNQLISWLTSCDTSKVDVAAIERHIDRSKLWYHEGSVAYSWVRARVLLNHPHGPLPEPALETLLHVDANREDFFRTGDGPFNQAITRTIARAAQALSEMGRQSDARHLLAIGRNRLPSYFAGRGLPAKTEFASQAVHELLSSDLAGTNREFTRRARLVQENAGARRTSRMINDLRS
ncbi:hypothetical protein CKM354_001199700 [Cercospora kikuchii]|uniref:Uncharacterized protein n=1 Tax=Cercospora kikuchii TaxID=84275 RepID=A0A9P3CQJ9_9PEZI|nr:uncharacterized protein CKM354_001199700 [Cercospora kikuchii]GIZ48954.1 hypothetical protein CKM354_001199700 [Cercospora kikuchii]